MKKVLLQILKDRGKGLIMGHSQICQVQNEWLKLFGSPYVSHYPYTSDNDMFKDLLEYYKIN